MANESSGACAPRSASARKRSSDVGSAQCRSSKASDNRLGPRPRQNPGGHCRQLPAPQLFGREFRGAVRRQRNVHERREQGRMFGWVEPINATCLRGRRGAVRLAASAPKRSLPHSAIGCSGVFCKSCEALHSTQVCGVSPSCEWNSSMSRDLPSPGSPTISTSWPSPARARSQRRAAVPIPPRGRRTALASSRRPFGRRRWRERRG